MFHWGIGNSLSHELSGSLVESDHKLPRLGDLVVFLERQGTACHRLLGKRKTDGLWWYLLKGDNHSRSDGWYPEYRVLGRVRKINGQPVGRIPFSFGPVFSTLRKVGGNFLFGIWSPPRAGNSRWLPSASDYGHGFLHDEMLMPGTPELSFLDRRQIAGPILDLGGGSGRLAVPLVERGFSVTLVDRSRSMVTEAQSKLARSGKSDWKAIVADHTSLPVGHYASLLLLGNVLEHLPTVSDIENALNSAHAALAPEGRLFLDVHYLPHFLKKKRWKMGRWEYQADRVTSQGRFRLWSRTLSGSMPSNVVVEHAMTRNMQHFHLSRQELKLLPPSLWVTLTEKAGFQVLGQWGTWTEGPPQGGSTLFILELAKAKTTL